MFKWLHRQPPVKTEEQIAAETVRNAGQPALKLLLEICHCWNEARAEASALSPYDQDTGFAVLFRDKFHERASVPMQKIFDKVNREFHILEKESKKHAPH